MNPTKVTPQDQTPAPVTMKDDILATCPTCVSGIEATTLEKDYLAILKR